MGVIRKLGLVVLGLIVPAICWAQPSPARLNIKTEDGTVNTYPYQLRVTNGDLTDNNDGTASLSISGGGGGGGAGIVSPGTFTWVNNYGESLSTLTVSGVTASTITVSSMTVQNITINGTCTGAGCGSGGGSSIYPATATASFPFGAVFSTISVAGVTASTVTASSGTISNLSVSTITLALPYSGYGANVIYGPQYTQSVYIGPGGWEPVWRSISILHGIKRLPRITYGF